MSDLSQTTNIEGVTWGDGPNFQSHEPLGADIRVMVRNADDVTQTFLIELSDGRYRPDRGSWIVKPEKRKRIGWDHPLFDIPTIIEAAESFMDEQTAIIETGYTTSDGDSIDVIVTPERVHVAVENRHYADPETSSYQQPRFFKSFKVCDTQSGAETFVAQYFNQPDLNKN